MVHWRGANGILSTITFYNSCQTIFTAFHRISSVLMTHYYTCVVHRGYKNVMLGFFCLCKWREIIHWKYLIWVKEFFPFGWIYACKYNSWRHWQKLNLSHTKFIFLLPANKKYALLFCWFLFFSKLKSL